MPDILEELCGDVAIITLNRPDRLNAFSDDLLYGLREAIEHHDANPSIGCIVLTGAGRAFCAGGDVKALAGRLSMGFEERVDDLGRKQLLSSVIRDTATPTIAMINGAAVGAGLALALACDVRYAAANARFGTGFRGVGFSGDFGTSFLLTDVVGTARARELYFTGRLLDAAEAERIGLIETAFNTDDLRRKTLEQAARFAARHLDET